MNQIFTQTLKYFAASTTEASNCQFYLADKFICKRRFDASISNALVGIRGAWQGEDNKSFPRQLFQ